MKLASLLAQHPAAYLLFLNRLPGVRSRRWPHLIKAIETTGCQLLTDASVTELTAAGFPKEALAGLLECRNQGELAASLINGVLVDIEWLQQQNRHLIVRGSAHYPALLEQIFDPPNVLFVEGNINALSPLCVAIVGARNPTLVGRERAFQFAERFAQAEVITVSGLALGIDAQAHRGALHGKGKTLAVLAGGL
ncbi:MAG TPA: DNA-processing protein DprA, partial [Pseudomonadales bacterium]|nr:DNA-processing protein DprA [Pseudomonadales bacterium]